MPVVPTDVLGDTMGGQSDLSPFLLSQFNLNRSIHQRGTQGLVPLVLSPIRIRSSTGIRAKGGHLLNLSAREVGFVFLGTRTLWDE